MIRGQRPLRILVVAPSGTRCVNRTRVVSKPACGIACGGCASVDTR